MQTMYSFFPWPSTILGQLYWLNPWWSSHTWTHGDPLIHEAMVILSYMNPWWSSHTWSHGDPLIHEPMVILSYMNPWWSSHTWTHGDPLIHEAMVILSYMNPWWSSHTWSHGDPLIHEPMVILSYMNPWWSSHTWTHGDPLIHEPMVILSYMNSWWSSHTWTHGDPLIHELMVILSYMNPWWSSHTWTHGDPLIHEPMVILSYMNSWWSSHTWTHGDPLIHEPMVILSYMNSWWSSHTWTHGDPLIHELMVILSYMNSWWSSHTWTHGDPLIHELMVILSYMNPWWSSHTWTHGDPLIHEPMVILSYMNPWWSSHTWTHGDPLIHEPMVILSYMNPWWSSHTWTHGDPLIHEPMVILSYMKPSAFVDKTWLCRLFSSLIHTFPSTVNILILSVTRVITIIFPVHYKELITTRRMYIALAGKYLILLGFVSISNPFWASKFSMKYKQCFVNYNHLGEKPGSRVEWEGLDHNITVPILHVTAGIIIFLINMVVVCMLFRIKLKKLCKMPTVFRAGVELVLLVAAYMITTISIPAIFITDLLDVKLSPKQVSIFSFVAKVLFYIQPIVNPVIYIVQRPEYRFNVAGGQTTFRVYRDQQQNIRFYKSVRMVIISNRFVNNIKQDADKKRNLNMSAVQGSIQCHVTRKDNRHIEGKKHRRLVQTPIKSWAGIILMVCCNILSNLIVSYERMCHINNTFIDMRYLLMQYAT